MSTTVALSRNSVEHVGGFVHRKKELPNDFEWNINKNNVKIITTTCLYNYNGSYC